MIGLYLHIPFCTRLCHYCDFVKTARFAAEEPRIYVQTLTAYAKAWLETLGQPVRSVFLGGGTPSLLDREFQPLLQQIQPWLTPGAEITLEANPEHIFPEKLEIWAKLGVNRLSLGVQSFAPEGLKFLTREHSAERAIEAVRLAQQHIPNVNIDLIYGWQGQTLDHWQRDLEQATQLGLQHLSLYTLTYEGRTPLARRQKRGVLEPIADDVLEAMYQKACETLRQNGYLHEEVSNWHKPGFASVHNSIYWHSGSYVGLGNGAHSFLEDYDRPWGTRWSQDANLRLLQEGQKLLGSQQGVEELLTLPGVHVETERGASEWLLEVVSSGLRTEKGINVNAICAKTGYNFRPRPSVEHALRQGLMRLDPRGILILREDEWYRETGWALEASLSFVAT